MATETSTRADDAPEGEGAMVRVTLVRSTIGYDRKQREVVRGLGLRRIGHTVVVKDHPAIRGMITKVQHLVTVGR